ncbi:hypothetical protein [Kordia sp.]|uniref:hypothetical protein n=1 Tax=Kordia sp. TaxID=1965332 RepID=UPI003B5A82B7
MTKIKIFLLLITGVMLTNCGNEERFPLNKRYWTIDDYTSAISELRYGYKDDEKLPTFSNPETRRIVEKFTDEQNFLVVLEDKELGLKYKNQVAEDFFMKWKLMIDIYDALDRKDNYVYDREMLATYHFGLGLQLQYFGLGNEEIKASADDPESSYIKSRLNSNINTLVNNYKIYLDLVNEENRFSEEGQKLYADGITKYFIKLVSLYPDANYKSMERKVDLMLNKTKVPVIESALTTLKTAITNTQEVPKENE